LAGVELDGSIGRIRRVSVRTLLGERDTAENQ
jgi:hypothetical protein